MPPTFAGAFPHLPREEGNARTLPKVETIARIVSGIRHNDVPAVHNACEAIYRSWIRYVCHAEALHQAQNFARRYDALAADKSLMTEPELDAMLGAVAGVMAAS